MEDGAHTYLNIEASVAREILKAACKQQLGGSQTLRSSLSAKPFDFLTTSQQHNPESSLPFISKQWVPVGTKAQHSSASSISNTTEKLLQSLLPAQPRALLSTPQTATPAQGQPGQPSEGDIAMRNNRKRERPASEAVVDTRWALKRKLAVLSQDIELLTEEVAGVRDGADASCAAPKLTLEEKAALAEKHAKKLADAQKRGIAVILRDIMGHKFANPFLKPVDTKLYPDYPSKVSKPLDFGTVKARLDAGNYTNSLEAFVKDMSQIFENAFQYNAPGSTVHGWTVTLKEKFEERLKSLNTRLAGVEAEQSKEEEEILDIAKRRLQDKAWESLTMERRRLEPHLAAMEARIKQLKSEAAAGCTFVSLAEKHSLMESLGELKTEDFEQAMQIILHRHPGLLQSNNEVLDIDFDPLDSLTLRQLAAFCHFCLKGTNPEFNNAWPGLLFGAGAKGVPLPGSRPEATPIKSENADTEERLTGAAKDMAAPVNPIPNPQVSGEITADGHTKESTLAKKSLAEKESVQTREVGERSWSVLDIQAVTELKSSIDAIPAQSKD